jgi:hypothetical protein
MPSKLADFLKAAATARRAVSEKNKEVQMWRQKLTVRLVTTMMLLSLGFVLYPQGPANAAKFCAELRGATASGHPDCSFATLSDCRSHVRSGGGGHCYKLRQ